MPIADTQTALAMNAKSLEVRRAKRELRDNPPQLHTQPPASALCARADALDKRLEALKLKLDDAIAEGQSQDALRYAQAIDRLEQSWARYAGIPTPPKARPQSRRTPPAAGPLD